MGMLVWSVGEKRAAEADDRWKKALLDTKGTAFAAAWRADMAGLEGGLRRLVEALCKPDVRRALAMRGRKVGAHDRVRDRIPFEEGVGDSYVVGADGTLFVAETRARVGQRDALLAAVADGENGESASASSANSCSGDEELNAALPVISRSADGVFVWASHNVEVGRSKAVAMVGKQLTGFESVANGGDLWLTGQLSEGAGAGEWRVAGSPWVQEPVPGARLKVADVRWLGWGREPGTVRGRLFVGLPTPDVAAPRWWNGTLLLVVAVSLGAALLLVRRLAATIALPIEKVAHKATITSLGRGRVYRSFRSEGGGPELVRIAGALNTMVERAGQEQAGSEGRGPRR